jgi:AraC family transcriptional regulator of adaptative response / DNA-3-methyladenine glycosylase II
VVEALQSDPRLAAVVAKAPGQRIPRTVDESELALRVVIGQQVSIKAACTHVGRLVAGYGTTLSDEAGGLTHVFPDISDLAGLDPSHLAMPASRKRTITALVAAIADGELVLDPGCDWERARAQLLALPGVGPWTTEVIAMRGLGDPDAFPATDLGVRAAAALLDLGQDELVEHSTTWRPWRAYATQHLWTTLDHAVNEWPPTDRQEKS